MSSTSHNRTTTARSSKTLVLTLLQLFILYKTIIPIAVDVEAVRLQQGVHCYHISRYSSSAPVQSSSLGRFRGGALVPEVGQGKDRISSWKLGFTLRRSLTKDEDDADVHAAESSNESLDYDDNDDDNILSKLTNLISELLVKFKKEEAINAVCRYCYHI